YDCIIMIFKSMKKLTDKQKRLFDILLFLIRFFLLSFVLHFFIWLNIDMYRIELLVADIIGFFLAMFGIAISRADTLFIFSDSSGTLVAQITRDCIAWKSILAFVCLIFATNTGTPIKKIQAMIAGSIIIFVANIVRLTTTFAFINRYGIIYFDFIHNLLWQGGMILLIIYLWNLMMTRISFSEKKRK
ncbi:MAG: exosortase/archaeosortase family protein, partial [Candidatus Aenigmarchaeota archaeon]|nr:exosortase/archaeosortase family protein [Candidatus Aenigmarchaeota archaeon]